MGSTAPFCNLAAASSGSSLYKSVMANRRAKKDVCIPLESSAAVQDWLSKSDKILIGTGSRAAVAQPNWRTQPHVTTSGRMLFFPRSSVMLACRVAPRDVVVSGGCIVCILDHSIGRPQVVVWPV